MALGDTRWSENSKFNYSCPLAQLATHLSCEMPVLVLTLVLLAGGSTGSPSQSPQYPFPINASVLFLTRIFDQFLTPKQFSSWKYLFILSLAAFHILTCMLQLFPRLFYPADLVELQNNVGRDLSLEVFSPKPCWKKARPSSKPYQLLRASSR